jgi:hypothetical protein
MHAAAAALPELQDFGEKNLLKVRRAQMHSREHAR